MCEVLSDVHVYNKFDLLPDTSKNVAISRFEFYLPTPNEVSACDVKEPPPKKQKLGQINADSNGDLVLERRSRRYKPESPETSESHVTAEESHNEDLVSEEAESSDDDNDGENYHKTDFGTSSGLDMKTLGPQDGELCVITLRHSLATELAEVGEQVWLGALLLCDYIIYRGEDFRNKTVVDLGSGTGLTSVVAALFAGSVYCTDVGQNILDIAKHNVSNHTLQQEHNLSSIHVKELDWFKPVKASDESPYGLTAEDVSSVLSAEIIIAADVVYDDDITDAFIKTILTLMAEPPSKKLIIGLEKRLVFTMEDLDIATPGYDHFRRKLQEIESSSSKQLVTYRVEQIKTDFPQYFKYNRTKELELWMVEAVFAGT